MNEQDTTEPARCFDGHTDVIYHVGFCPNGRRVISYSSDTTIRLWDVGTGRELRRFERPICDIAFSPNGITMFSAGEDHTLTLWNVADGVGLRRFEGHRGPVHSIALSVDGQLALSGSGDGTARLWDIERGEIWCFQDENVLGVALSPDGHHALTASSAGTAAVWDTGSGEKSREFILSEDEFWGVGVAFSPDGRYGLVDGWSKAIIDIQAMKTLDDPWNNLGFSSWGGGRYSHGAANVAFSPDGSYLLTGHFQTVRLWDLRTGKETQQFDGLLGHVNSVAFSPDGRWVLSGGQDGLCLWSVANGRRLHQFVEHTAAIYSAAFSPCGKWVLSGGGEYVVEGGSAIRKDGKFLPNDCTVRLRPVPTTLFQDVQRA